MSPPVKIEESTVPDDGFEEIKLDDSKPKKRGIFARMLDSNDDNETNGRPTSSHEKTEKTGPWHHLTGRKRGQSGQGAELGAVPKRDMTPKPEKQIETTQAAKQEIKDIKPASTQAPEIRIES